MLNLGGPEGETPIRILRSSFRGTGPAALCSWGDDPQCVCAVLVADCGWVPCWREAGAVEIEARGNGEKKPNYMQ